MKHSLVFVFFFNLWNTGTLLKCLFFFLKAVFDQIWVLKKSVDDEVENLLGRSKSGCGEWI